MVQADSHPTELLVGVFAINSLMTFNPAALSQIANIGLDPSNSRVGVVQPAFYHHHLDRDADHLVFEHQQPSIDRSILVASGVLCAQSPMLAHGHPFREVK